MTNEQKIEKLLIKKKILCDKESFSWDEHSDYVAIFCPQLLNIKKYDWKNWGREIAEHCPQHFDTNKYNWRNHSWAVIKYCPEKLDTSKANLKNILEIFPQYKNMSLEEIKKKAILNKL